MDPEIMKASELPELDTSYYIPWSLAMIYAVEPRLETISRLACDEALINSHKRGRAKYARQDAYVKARNEAETLIGWHARDPRLRSQEAWDYYIDSLS